MGRFGGITEQTPSDNMSSISTFFISPFCTSKNEVHSLRGEDFRIHGDVILPYRNLTVFTAIQEHVTGC